ncbi:universal stress protein [Actinomadura nitritigenes]|jgi:nucleotide-binding universal stress UspA family protein|uniref:universal stress protein n=1 Tax=Actinomadura TaxID=1988 RepID=UPI0016879C92|nr:universal stress protein [Actinomadura sp. RB99]MBD2891553.1 Universal stress protein [Actinomadura sp. RB99]
MDGLDRAQRPHVLLGYDATEGTEAALRWAVDEARLRGLDLVLCHCWHWPYAADHVDDDVEAIIKRAGEKLLERGEARAAELGAPGAVGGRLRAGPVADALLHEAGDAELIVIGSRERHQLPVGSTAVQLPARARRPVVAVRHYGRAHGLVVAGVDGSAGGDAALGFAMEEAASREWGLRVVFGVWEPWAVDEAELALFADKERLAQVRAVTLERAVAPWRHRYPKVDLRASVVMDRPREALLEAAEDADLLVVGDRGAGGLGPLLLGATSSAMLQHAPCAVAIVPSAA